MKATSILSLVVIAAVAVRCANAEPVATGYKKNLDSGSAESNAQTPAPTPSQQPSMQTPGMQTPAMQTPGMQTPAASGAGNKANGDALLTSGACSACHPAIAKGLAVGKDMIPRMDKVMTGPGKDSHNSLPATKTALEAKNIPDIKAALEAK